MAQTLPSYCATVVFLFAFLFLVSFRVRRRVVCLVEHAMRRPQPGGHMGTEPLWSVETVVESLAVALWAEGPPVCSEARAWSCLMSGAGLWYAQAAAPGHVG